MRNPNGSFCGFNWRIIVRNLGVVVDIAHRFRRPINIIIEIRASVIDWVVGLEGLIGCDYFLAIVKFTQTTEPIGLPFISILTHRIA